MVSRGKVQNGVVVPMDGFELPEGEEVTLILADTTGTNGQSILDISPVSLGRVLRSPTEDDDFLGEMLEGRT